MFTVNTTQRRIRRLHAAGVALAAALLLAGCATPVGDAPLSQAEPTPTASGEAVTWSEIWDEAYGENGENVREIDGMAEDFPAEVPLPDGELAHSVIGDDMWSVTFETDDAPAQADELRERIGETMPAVDEGTTPDDGQFWVFLDDRFMIQLQMQPGPRPPAMVSLTVVRRG